MTPPSAAALLALTTPTLGAAGASMLTPGALRPMWNGAACAGPARTVSCSAADNLAIHAAVAEVGVDEVLVVAVEGRAGLGYWGEILTVAAQSRGAAGLLITACIRDLEAIERRKFPAFAAGTALDSTTKVGPGAVGCPVVVGGVEIAQGDIVVADVDGVVAIPRTEAVTVVERAAAHAEREAEMMAAIGRGASTIELLGLDDVLPTVERPVR